MDPNKFKLPSKFSGMEANMWVEFMELAEKNNAVNLGQGFPDFLAPSPVREALAQVAASQDPLVHQYARAYVYTTSVRALSRLYGDLIGRSIDPADEVVVTSGAADALFCAIFSNVSQGDEVIIIEPFFDAYEPLVRIAGGKPVFVPLRPAGDEVTSSDDWVLDEREFSSKFNHRTKAIIVNTPHNPLGKVFNRNELESISKLCIKWDVMCIMDEVYEWIVFEPDRHIRMATLPGMWERTLTICSAGKTFSITGWKIGFAYGPKLLIQNTRTVHQHTIYSCNKPLQEALARVYELEIERFGTDLSYFQILAKLVKEKRDLMVRSLQQASFKPIIPSGGYFLIADWSNFERTADLSQWKDPQKDFRFVKWMSTNMKIQSIPTTAFYSAENKNISEKFIRFCMVKDEKVLNKANEILEEWTFKNKS